MTDKKQINNEEQVADVSSLIALCQRTDDMSAIQKLALKQKVAFHFEYSLRSYMRNEGTPSNKFGAYISLLETKPQFYGNVCDILTENFVSEEIVEECLMYIRSGVIPYQFWIDKLLMDLRESFYYGTASISGLLTVYLGMTLKTSLIAFNKVIKALEEDIDKYNDDVKEAIEFNKIRALEIPQNMKEEYMHMFATNDESERVKFVENETKIFTKTLIDMLKFPFNHEIIEKMATGTVTPFEDFWVTPLGGGSSALLSNARGAGNTMVQSTTETQNEEEQPAMSWWEMLGYGPLGESKEEMQRRKELARRQRELNNRAEELLTTDDKERAQQIVQEIQEDRHSRVISNEQNVEWCVKKIAKDGSKRVMSENWFPSEQKAREFIREVTESNPMMSRAFEFVAEPGVRQS